MSSSGSDDVDEEQLLASIKQRKSRLNAKPIGAVVRRLMSQRGYGQTQSADVLAHHWSQILGEQLASLTRPGNVVRGVLHVEAASHLAAQELGFQKKAILAELDRNLPQMKIRDLRVRVATMR